MDIIDPGIAVAVLLTHGLGSEMPGSREQKPHGPMGERQPECVSEGRWNTGQSWAPSCREFGERCFGYQEEKNKFWRTREQWGPFIHIRDACTHVFVCVCVCSDF